MHSQPIGINPTRFRLGLGGLLATNLTYLAQGLVASPNARKMERLDVCSRFTPLLASRSSLVSNIGRVVGRGFSTPLNVRCDAHFLRRAVEMQNLELQHFGC